MNENLKGLEKLRTPFKAHEISLLPKQVKRDDTDKGKCCEGSKYSADGRYCGGYHARSIHLDYVGHAALTKRLLEVDPTWSWEPLALEDGLPKLDKYDGLWIRLKVCGHTRIGYGDSQGKTGPNAVKEAIGDALRNAGMRFGMALDLWHKGDLYDADELRGMTGEPPPSGQITPASGVWDQMSEEEQTFLGGIADAARNYIDNGDVAAAVQYIKDQRLTADEQVALWTRFNSKERSAMKEASAENK